MLNDIMAILDKYSYVFVEGIKWTLVLTVITVSLGAVLGTLVAFLKMGKNKVLNIIGYFYIEVIRGTPILLQMYFFWLWLPKLLGVNMSEKTSIIVALVVNSSAYIAEIIRAGIQAVDFGQREAAKSLGIRDSYMMRYVILPQAIKNILPAMGNQFIFMLKNTSLASTFFIGELMTSWRTVQTATYKPIPALMIVGIIYLLMTWSLTLLLGVYERRLAESD